MAFCPECGTKNEDGAKFCGNCGTNMDFQDQAYDSMPAKPQAQDMQSTPQAQPSYTPPANPNPQGYQGGQGYYQNDPAGAYAHQSQMVGGRIEHVMDPPSKRSWGLWFLGSMFLFGIPYIIYSYLILEDLNKLERNTTHQTQTHAPTEVNTALAVLLLFFFSPAYVYIKYNTFHEHLKFSHNAIEKPMSGTNAIVLMIAAFVLIWTFIVPMVIGIYFIYQEYKWQNVMNSHIQIHGLAMYS